MSCPNERHLASARRQYPNEAHCHNCGRINYAVDAAGWYWTRVSMIFPDHRCGKTDTGRNSSCWHAICFYCIKDAHLHLRDAMTRPWNVQLGRP